MSCFKKTFITIKLILFISLNTAFAQDPDTIIAAKVNDHIISAKDVLIALEKLPEKIKEQPLPSIYPKLINELINQHLIAQQAYKEKLDQNKKVLSELNKSKEQIMAKFWLKNFLDKQAKKKNIEAFYKNYLKNFKVSKEFNASHILVKEKKTASEIIKKLNNKSNFTDLAKQFSIGPSGKNGGNLNWFSPGQMVQSFEEATFALNKGQITQKPVQTKFGFHIIILNDVRESKPKKLSEIEQQIIKIIKKNSLLDLEKKLKKNQKIIINKFEEVAKKVNN
jgi:peptidyl-prolyl cis-trans isomerase C